MQPLDVDARHFRLAARWGLLVVALLLGLALVAASLHSHPVRGIVTAVVLMAAAGALWRLSEHETRAEAKAERQLHLAALGEMSAVLAHEIRNPLAVAKGHAQLLAEEIPMSDVRRVRVDMVVQHLVRLEGLIASLLEFARAGEIRVAAASPIEVLEEAARAVNAPRVAVDIADAPTTWRLDGPRMRQVLVNVIHNAVQAGSTTPVDARVALRGSWLEFTVRDRGPGVSTGEVARMFSGFYTTKAQGTGLGLAFARRVVQLHGGTIALDNHPEGGALVRIALPPG